MSASRFSLGQLHYNNIITEQNDSVIVSIDLNANGRCCRQRSSVNPDWTWTRVLPIQMTYFLSHFGTGSLQKCRVIIHLLLIERSIRYQIYWKSHRHSPHSTVMQHVKYIYRVIL